MPHTIDVMRVSDTRMCAQTDTRVCCFPLFSLFCFSLRQYGYFFFWCLSLGLTFLTFLVLFINGWMPCAECNRCADNFDDEED